MSNENTVTEDRTDVPAEIKADLRRFNKAEEQVTKAVTALTAIKKIEDADQLATAMEVLSGAAKVEKLIEAKRVEIVKPLNDQVKKVNDYAKKLAGVLPPAINNAKQVVITYNRDQQVLLEKRRIEVRVPQLQGLALTELVPGTYSFEGITVPGHIITGFDDNQWNAYIQTLTVQISNKKAELLAALEKAADLNDAFGSEQDKQETAQHIELLQAPVDAPGKTYLGAGSIEKVKGITRRWTHSIVDEALVPREYLVVDTVKIARAIREGAREIPGINIYQEDGLTVRS